MKRPKLKKASKRISCGKRYKIQKKVRDHTKKLRREAKKKGITKRPKKDPGVPNTAPFKEEVLREAEQRRLKIEEEKEKKRLVKIEQRAQKRKKEASDKKSDPKAKKARTEKANKQPDKQTAVDKSSQLFLCAELNKVIDASDVIIEVLDARDPLGYRCPQLEEAVLKREGDKKLLLVLNKIDLVPKENAERWIQYLQREFPVVAFKASTLLHDKTVIPNQQVRKRKIIMSNGVLDRTKGAAGFGDSSLLDLLVSYAATLQREDALNVGIVGFPNVGKSSLINTMKGFRACNAGVQRGLTKTLQDVHVFKHVKMLDSPGIVASPSNPPAALSLRSLQVEDGQGGAVEAACALLKQCDKTQMMLQYNVPDFRSSLEFLTHFAKKRGFMRKGGIFDTEQAATVFLKECTGAKLSYYSKVPEDTSLPSYLSETTVSELQKGWSLGKLKHGNELTLKAMKCPTKASSISFLSSGPTVGMLDVTDIPLPPLGLAPPAVEAESENEEEEEELEDLVEESPEPAGGSQEEPIISKSTKVQFQSDVGKSDVGISTAKTDAYDFNTDFK